MPAGPPIAFFSYSRDDSEFALRLAEDLKAAGASVWLDQLDIQPGQRWARAVQEALNNAERMLVILSPASVGSSHVEDEVAFALEESKTVIPVFYRDCKVPFQLRPLQYVDFRADYERGVKLLLRGLGVVLSESAVSTVPESKPPSANASEAAPPAKPKRARKSKSRNPASARELTPDEMSAKGDEYLDRGDHDGAFLMYSKSAEAGSIAGMANLGAMYQNGYGVTRNYKSALTWYRRAADAQDPSAMYLLGVMYANGRGVPADGEEAIRLFRSAAELGNPNAMCHLGSLYLGGMDGIEQDFSRALDWYRKAAEAGDDTAMRQLGLMYEKGYGVRKSRETAISWYRKALELGDTDAAKALKRLGAQ